MDFPKRWIFASLIVHAFLLVALRFIYITNPPAEYIPHLSIEIIDSPEEIIEKPSPAASEDIQNSIQNDLENIIESEVFPEVLDRSVEIEKFVVPDDIMFVKKEVDSIRIEMDRLRKYYAENKVVPFESRFRELLDMEPITNVPDVTPNKPMSLRDSLQNIVSNSRLLKFNLDDYAVLNDIVADEYYSKYTNPTFPVVPLILQGLSLAGKLFSKIFNVDTPEETNRFLTVIEIRLMKVVWKQKEIAPSELYAQLPVDIPLTMIDVLGHLEQLHLKRILKKRKKSTKEVFYPVISRKDLFAFYLAVYTESLHESNTGDTNGSAGMLLTDLKDKLILLSSDDIKH